MTFGDLAQRNDAVPVVGDERSLLPALPSLHGDAAARPFDVDGGETFHALQRKRQRAHAKILRQRMRQMG
ncbi:MAG: hypothetical protein N2383_14200, partial [Caldilineales bacterium]|nr:hypothetical protein [Caldilineales bacterium]